MTTSKPTGPLGVGIGLRGALFDELAENDPREVSFVELHPENYIGRGGEHSETLATAQHRWPIISHGLSNGLGNTTSFDPTYLGKLKEFLHRIDAPWHSEHLCFTSGGQVFHHELLPVPFSRELVQTASTRMLELADAIERPVALENISHYVLLGSTPDDEAEVIGEVLERANAFLLLDVNNVFVNAKNHGFDPYRFIEKLPLDRVVQIHVAGHLVENSGLRIDTHAEAICDEVYELLGHTLARTGAVPVLLERDGNYPELNELLEEARRLVSIYERSLGRRRSMTTTDRTPTLADTERHLLTWCFSPQPEPTALTALGQQQDERWAHYRNAVRRQLARVCEVALPRCNRLAPHWDTWLTEFFAKAPPTTRYFWQVPLEFVRYLELREEHAAQELADLFRLEAAQWEVKNTANRDSPLLTDFDFSGIAVLNHTLQLLELSTPAHRIPVEEAPDQPSAQDNAAPSARMPSRYRLAIFRDIHSHEPATWELNLSSFILLELLAQSERSIAEAAQAAAAHLSIPFDQHYLEGLSDFFAKALGAGLVLGIAADE